MWELGISAVTLGKHYRGLAAKVNPKTNKMQSSLDDRFLFVRTVESANKNVLLHCCFTAF